MFFLGGSCVCVCLGFDGEIRYSVVCGVCSVYSPVSYCVFMYRKLYSLHINIHAFLYVCHFCGVTSSVHGSKKVRLTTWDDVDV